MPTWPASRRLLRTCEAGWESSCAGSAANIATCGPVKLDSLSASMQLSAHWHVQCAHQSASTTPVRECFEGQVECSVVVFIATNTNDTLTHQSVQISRAPSTTHSLSRYETTKTPTPRPWHGRLNVQAKRRARWENWRKEGGRGARDRLLPLRESRAALRRASNCERRGWASAHTKRIGARGAPAPAKDAAARSGWTGWMMSLLPAHTGGQESWDSHPARGDKAGWAAQQKRIGTCGGSSWGSKEACTWVAYGEVDVLHELQEEDPARKIDLQLELSHQLTWPSKSLRPAEGV